MHHHPLQAFPPYSCGQMRYFIHMPKVEDEEDEDALRVELQVGKTIETDGFNRYFFGGALEKVPIPGWGFERLVLKELGPLASTKMMPPPGSAPVKQFVRLGGEPELLRYNSRLPIAVYVPEDVEVKYRFWRADKETSSPSRG